MLTLEPGTSASVSLTTTVERTVPSALDADPGSDAVTWSGARMEAADPRVAEMFAAAVDDLRHLLLRDPVDRNDVFAGAGTPWYLTLFGRDSLWAARMMLPFGTELAAGTLRTLARRQGQRVDESSAEAPGRSPRAPPHGIPRPGERPGAAAGLLRHGRCHRAVGDAARRGLAVGPARGAGPSPAAQPACGRRLADRPGQPDVDGLLKYLDTTGTGLANQGWKDSGDSIRWRDGRIADAPIALVEAQAYAVEALNHAARTCSAGSGRTVRRRRSRRRRTCESG